jgi:hypothetical protein
VFSSNGTWVAQAGDAILRVVVISGGGGGGSGFRQNVGFGYSGGAGGGGNVVERWLSVADIAATVPITIGAGGLGGVGNVSGGQNGIAGGDGGPSFFGTYVAAYGYNGGINGGSTFSVALTGNTGGSYGPPSKATGTILGLSYPPIVNHAPGYIGTQAVQGCAINTSVAPFFSAGPGQGGAAAFYYNGVATFSSGSNGGAGYCAGGYIGPLSSPGGLGGAAIAGTPYTTLTAGNSGTNGSDKLFRDGFGGGGGGGGNGGVSGGNGGNGGYPGGGGGGGGVALISPFANGTGGSGGNGGAGEVRVYVYG